MIDRRGALAGLAALPFLAGADDAASGLQPRERIESRFVPGRTIQLWLPPDYAGSKRATP
jgi:hypothetical protein